MKALTYVEIDVDHCALVYGEHPCTAEVGETGERKCFNSLGTCQDRGNFANAPKTIRFSENSAHYAEVEVFAIPAIENVSITPATISLGEDLGQRATVSITFVDPPWPDVGEEYDKYRDERDYDPFERGTYWGKFRARNPYLRGRKLRLISGVMGQTYPLGALDAPTSDGGPGVAETMEVRHYIIDSFSGPTPEGRYTLIARDPLKLADGDRAQAPRVSNGFLIADIDENDTSVLLNPNGIGELEYPASGWVAIGGSEICAFTRAGDTLTITRGQFGTEAQEHSAGDRAQLCLRYAGAGAADIVRDLFENYAGIDPAYIDVNSWRDETENFLRRQFSALIAEPTAVATLVSELVEQAALAIWWDDLGQRIRLQVLRQISTDAVVYDQQDYAEDSISSQDQPNSRISQVWTYYAQINPLRPVTDPDNYRSIATTVDLQSETDEGTPAVKKIFARWTPAGGRLLALRVNDIQLGRYRSAPRRISFETFRYAQVERRPVVGQGYQIIARHFQDETGAAMPVPIQATRIAALPDRYRIEAEEMRFIGIDPEDLDNRVIIYDSNIPNVNFRQTHDLLFPPPEAGDEVTFIIESGATIWSQSNGQYAAVVGFWPAGVIVNVIVRGRIQGRAGNGGAGARQGGGAGFPGEWGGPGIYTRHPINLILNQGSGQIFGGGGGGGGGGWGRTQTWVGTISNRTGGGGGGGGAGFLPGTGGIGGVAADGSGQPGQPGTVNAGGAGGSTGARGGVGGAGGNPGQAGFGGANGNLTSGGPGGAPGTAINGVSYVTKTGAGDIRGAQTD